MLRNFKAETGVSEFVRTQENKAAELARTRQIFKGASTCWPPIRAGANLRKISWHQEQEKQHSNRDGEEEGAGEEGGGGY